MLVTATRKEEKGMLVTATLVKRLRNETGRGMMECKKALLEMGGHYERAKKLLKENPSRVSDPSIVKTATVSSYIHGEGSIGVLIKVMCVTDFVARTEEYKRLVQDIMVQIAATDPTDIPTLLSETSLRYPSLTIQDLLNEKVSQLGEPIEVLAFTRYTSAHMPSI